MTIVTNKQNKKVNDQPTYGGCILVLQALCSGLVQYNNQPWGHKDALFVLNWPATASLQTWCVLRLGTTGCVHLCVSLRLEIRFGFKSAQICGLLLLHRGSLSLGHSHHNATMSVFYTRSMFLFLIYLNCCCTVHLTQLCVYRSRGCYAGARGSLSFLSTASGVLNDLSTPLSVLLICSSLELSWWDNPIFTFSQPYLMLAFPVKATECSDMIKDKSK